MVFLIHTELRCTVNHASFRYIDASLCPPSLSCLVSIRSHSFLYVLHIEKFRIFSVNSESGQAKERIETDDLGEIYCKLNFVTVPFINTLLQAARFFSHARRVYLYSFQKTFYYIPKSTRPPFGKHHCLRVLLIYSPPQEQTEI